MEGVLKEEVPAPPSNILPPLGLLYQSATRPLLVLAPNKTEPEPHLDPFTVIEAEGNGFTVIEALADVSAVHTPLVTTAL